LDNVLSVPFTYTFDVADYYILVDADKIQSVLGEVWEGITNSTDWNFTIVGAEFDSTEFTNEFLI
jgi:hypothetical protein